MGIGGQIPVVLTVAEADVPRLVASMRGGDLDLVAVPLASQSVTGDTSDGGVNALP